MTMTPHSSRSPLPTVRSFIAEIRRNLDSFQRTDPLLRGRNEPVPLTAQLVLRSHARGVAI